jgi:uncharacterized RDD family membrane protein YckC
MECPNCGNRVQTYSQRCGSCGVTIPPGQYLLEKSGVVQRSAPMQHAPLRRVQRTPATASLGDRLIATGLDSMVILSASAIVSVWSFKEWGISSGDEFHLTAASLLIACVLSAAMWVLYPWFLEACFGATLGKVIVGIRVVRSRTRSSLAASTIRNALRIVDGIGFYTVGAIVAGFSRERQRLGDILAGTIVVEETFGFSAKLVAVVFWLAALTGAGWGLPRVCAAGFSNQPPRYFATTVVQLGARPDSFYLCVAGVRVDLHRDSATPPDGIAIVDSLR